MSSYRRVLFSKPSSLTFKSYLRVSSWKLLNGFPLNLVIVVYTAICRTDLILTIASPIELLVYMKLKCSFISFLRNCSSYRHLVHGIKYTSRSLLLSITFLEHIAGLNEDRSTRKMISDSTSFISFVTVLLYLQ
jgi:hypothetical protein